MTETQTRKRTWAAVGLLLVLTALPYATSLHLPFVYDDHGQIAENRFLQNPANLRDVLLLRTVGDPDVLNGRRPLVLLTYFVDNREPFRVVRFHLTNLLLHLGATCALFFLVRRLARMHDPSCASTLFGFTAALVFGIHPVLVEPVHVAAFRPDILYGLFMLGMLHAVLHLRSLYTGLRIAGALGALAFLFLGLLSKEAMAAAPLVVMGLWLFFPVTRPSRAWGLAFVGASAVCVAWYASRCIPSGTLQAATGTWNGLSLRPPSNLYTMPWIALVYARLLLLPYPLIIDRIVDPVAGAGDPRFIAGLLFLAGCAGATVLCRKRSPWIAFGLLWAFALFLPVSNIVPLFNPVAERYLYGSAMAMAVLVTYPLTHRGFTDPGGHTLRKIVLATICTAFLSMTWLRLADFTSNHELWRRTLHDEPRSARAHVWLGLEAAESGDKAGAFNHLDQAREANPREVSALINLGILHGSSGDTVKAESLLWEAVRLRPDKADAQWNLAIALRHNGKIEEAMRALRRTARADALHVGARRLLALHHLRQGEPGDAAAYLRQLLAITPGDEEAIHLLGIADPMPAEPEKDPAP